MLAGRPYLLLLLGCPCSTRGSCLDDTYDTSAPDVADCFYSVRRSTVVKISAVQHIDITLATICCDRLMKKRLTLRLIEWPLLLELTALQVMIRYAALKFPTMRILRLSALSVRTKENGKWSRRSNLISQEYIGR